MIRKAQEEFGKLSTIPCTSRHYCTEGRPKKIPVPEIFQAMNMQIADYLRGCAGTLEH